MIIEGEKYVNIDPYLEALTFFTKIPEVSLEFIKNKNYIQNDSSEQFNSLTQFIEWFKNNIYIKEGDNDEEITEKNKLNKNPDKMFDFLLDQLHKIFKGNKESTEKNKNFEKSDRIEALKLFEDFDNQNNSCINKLFFGKKIIIKTCNNCFTTYYLYRHLKVITLNIRDNVIDCNLESCLDNIERTFDHEFLCPNCSVKRTFKLSIKILEKPVYLIILITEHRSKHIKVPLYIYNYCYKLIGAEVTTERNKCGNIFNYLFKMCNKSHCKLLLSDINGNSDLIDEDKYLEGTPYVLFYKKIKEDEKNKSYKEYDFSDNKAKNIAELNDNNNINFNSKEDFLNKKK